MKKLFAKMRKIKMNSWNKLTLGEKVARVVMSMIKTAAIVVVGIAVIGIVVVVIGIAIAVIMGVAIAIDIVNAIAGGLYNGNRVYRIDDCYVRFR